MRYALLLALMLVGVCQGKPSLELVESFPSGTDFDQHDIRDTQEVWLELIDDAQVEILWQTFYVVHEEGEATGPVLEALKKAARRGVKIRLLVDPKFVKTYPETLDELAALDNIEVRHSPVGRWLGGVMHAKMMLVDGRSGVVRKDAGEESPGSTETRCRITSGGGDPRESAAESKPPFRPKSVR